MDTKTSAFYGRHDYDQDDTADTAREAIARARRLAGTPRIEPTADDRFEPVRSFPLRRGGTLHIERSKFSSGVALRFVGRDGHRSRVIIDVGLLADVIGALADELERGAK